MRLNEADAWRRIAENIASGDWSENGLCSEVRRLYYKRQILKTTVHQMHQRIYEHLRIMAPCPVSHSGDHEWFDQPGVAESRVLCALCLTLEVD